jgi:hypothetical protein
MESIVGWLLGDQSARIFLARDTEKPPVDRVSLRRVFHSFYGGCRRRRRPYESTIATVQIISWTLAGS